MEAEPVLVVDDVSVRFGSRLALDSVSLAVPAQRVVGLLGPNGAGKTTLISLVAGLRRPTSAASPCSAPAVRRGAERRRADRRRAAGDGALRGAHRAAEPALRRRALRRAERGSSRPRRCSSWSALVGPAQRSRRRLLGRHAAAAGDRARAGPRARAARSSTSRRSASTSRRATDLGPCARLRARGKTVLISTNYLDEAEALCDRVGRAARGQASSTVARPPELITRGGPLRRARLPARARAGAPDHARRAARTSAIARRSRPGCGST